MNPLEFITQNQTLVTFLLSGLGAFITRLVEKGRLRRKHREQIQEMQRQMEIIQSENEALKNKTNNK